MVAAPRAFLVLLAVLATGCASGLRVQADPPIDLSSVSSYQWTPATSASSTALSDRARAAVARRLAARGLAGGAEGDIAVSVTLETQAGKRVTDFGDDFFVPGHGPHPGIHVPGAYPQYDVQFFTEGQIAIDIYDTRSQALLWRGAAAAPIDPGNDQDIDWLVNALLRRAAD
jgi:hypothetical protein